MLFDCMYVNVKYYLMCVKLFKNAIKFCYTKRQYVSASEGLRPQTPYLGSAPGPGRELPSPVPLACAVLKFPLKIP